jgi:hypothetical protein
MATKPLPTGRQAYRFPVTVTYKKIKDENHSLLLTKRGIVTVALGEALIF